MFSTTRTRAVTRGLVVRAGAITLASVLTAGAAAAAPLAAGPRALSWTLGVPEVVTPGTELALPEGSFVSDYVVETTASGDDPEVVPQGTLRLTLSLFSPAADMKDQKKGQWYLSGKWSLLDHAADGAAAGRTTPGTLSGLITSVLPYNPADPANAARPWTSTVQVPFSSFLAVGDAGRGRNIRGDGTVSLGAGTANVLTLQLKVWPAIP